MQRAKVKNASRNKTTLGSGSVRIIAGKWRGRKLPVKDLDGLRPTTDRIKETVFNWLQGDIYEARCLDLFAGSGSLGFEALSRQAANVCFVEKSQTAFQQLHTNIQQLGANNAELCHTDALTFLANRQVSHPGFDLVFIDPPFRQDLLVKTCQAIEENAWLNQGALIYIETEAELGLPCVPTNWQLLKEKTAGQVSFRLYQKKGT